jgi:hypothetical protein
MWYRGVKIIQTLTPDGLPSPFAFRDFSPKTAPPFIQVRVGETRTSRKKPCFFRGPRPHPIRPSRSASRNIPAPSHFCKNRSRKFTPRFLPIHAYHFRISLLKFYSAKPISFGSFIHYVKGTSMPGAGSWNRKVKTENPPEEHFCSFKKRGWRAPIRPGHSQFAPFSAQTCL